VSAAPCAQALAVPRQNRQSAATIVITTPTAERLLARVAGGDRVAFAELYERYASAVYGACLRVLREPHAAEDAAQDAFAAIWRHAAAFDANRGAAGAWIGRVARNAALDANRRRALRVTAPEVDPVDEGSTPEELAVAADEAFQLRLALDTLPERERTVLGLAYGDGLTQSEIAARLDLPLGTVKTRTRSGLARLAEYLERVQ
jgi:RNA polymerase sigma-70 factor, ECF subfamily